MLQRLKFSLQKYRLGYAPGDVVLDVGSGNRPHPRADVLCDYFLLADGERGGALQVDRPLVGGDIEQLPFHDGSIDFVIASHLLEHVRDPQRAVGELQRVAKRGYIETPAEFGGKLLDMPFHRWYVRQDGGTLVFTGKSRAMLDDHLAEQSYRLWREGRDMQRLYWNHLELFLVRMSWSGAIDVRVIAPEGPLYDHPVSEPVEAEQALTTRAKPRTPGELAKAAIRRYYMSPLYGPARRADLEAICACPACHGALDFVGEAVRCKRCALAYPAVTMGDRRIPALLAAAATPIVADAAPARH